MRNIATHGQGLAGENHITYHGWWIVAVAAVAMSTGPGQFAFGALGLFIKPLGEEFGWDRAQVSLAATYFTITLAFSIPVIGQLADRYGSRLVSCYPPPWSLPPCWRCLPCWSIPCGNCFSSTS